MNWLAELQRRNVIRAAGLYVVGAWLVVQVAGTLLPVFDAPAWVMKTLVGLLAIAFLPALIGAWVFEVTPEGIKRDSEVAPGQSIAPQTARRMDRMIIVVLLLAVTFFAFDRWVLAPRREATLVATTTESVKAESAKRAEPQADRHSIAVLPFVNMSGDADNEYFSDGISEEILNVLAGTPGLQVAARTSSFSFKGKTMEVPDIAHELQVRMVLEGSVRKQGEQVRITAQLIDAQNGFHVWSQTYDRKLDDIFAIQDEIARAIGGELEVTMAKAGTSSPDSGGTRDVAAYDLYLRGMALFHGRDPEGLWQAIDLFSKASALDPDFAEAYAGQALVYTVLAAYSSRISWADALERSDEFALRSLALAPALPEPYAALSNSAITRLQRETGEALASRAIALRPSYATAYHWRGSERLASGDLEGSIEDMAQAWSLDPRSPVIADNYAVALLAAGQIDQARTVCEKALGFAPNFPGCLQYLGLIDLITGNYDEATPLLERAALVRNPGARSMPQDLAAALSGRADKRKLAQKLAALGFNSGLQQGSGNALEDHVVAAVLALLGQNDLALDYVERMSRELGSTMDWAIMLPTLDPIRCEPRFKAVVERMKTHDPYAAKVCAGRP